jgi:ABC-type nitrate/sulfonate/bicarbonate transport system substrate-binding protein
MKEGHIDGFCVGEPWNSAAALAGEGWIAATSATLEPAHPEKVLVVDDDLRQRRSEEYAVLRQTIVKACRHCDTPDGRAEAVDLMHSRRLFPMDRDVLANALVGPLRRGADQDPETRPFVIFSRNDANRATRDRALWLLDALSCSGVAPLDGAQRRACLDAFHDVDFPSPPVPSSPAPTRKSNSITN